MRRVPWLSTAILMVLVLGLPLVLSPFSVRVGAEILIMAIFAMSLGLIMGYAGLISLGHAAFFGTGAYTVALLGERLPNTYLLLLAAVAISGVLALVSGALLVRTSGAYFLMLTLAFGQVLFAVAFQAEPLTGGSDGMSVSAVADFGFGRLTRPLELYYIMAVAFLVSYLLLRLFVASPAGKAVKGVMENESRMKALGYNTRSYKLLVYTVSGMMASVAGALYAYFNIYVTPNLLGWLFSGLAMIMVIVGGVGTLLGPALGAGFFIVLQNYASSYTERWPLIMGIVFVAFVLVRRGGVIHLLSLAWQRVAPPRLRSKVGEGPRPPEELATKQEQEKTL
jgi:branched-chain amino acid transport system permease protein